MSELVVPGQVAAAAKAAPAPHELTQETTLHLLTFALRNHPQRLTIFPVDSVLMEVARQNEKRPAYIKLATLDSVVKNIRGTDGLRDYLLMLRIPREIGDRAFSPIAAPGES